MVAVLGQVERLGGEEAQQGGEIVESDRRRGVVRASVRGGVHGAAGGVRVVGVDVEVGSRSVILEETGESLRARPQAIVEADGRGGACYDANARITAVDAGVEGLEHSQVGAGSEIGVVGRSLRVEGSPEIGLVPYLDVPTRPAKCEARNSPSRPKSSRAALRNRVGPAGIAGVGRILRPRGQAVHAHKHLDTRGLQVIDQSVEARDLAGVIGAPILARADPSSR